MKQLLMIILIFYSFDVCAAAQDAEKCPSIRLSASSGSAGVGELLTYIVLVDNKSGELPLQYEWSASTRSENGGYKDFAIKRGQGTPEVMIPRPGSNYLLVVVKIKGLPNGCPDSATESAVWDPAPTAEKIYQIPPETDISETDLVKIIDQLTPSERLYVLGRAIDGNSIQKLEEKEREIWSYSIKHSFPLNRLTTTNGYSDHDLIQIWRVPPGADNPRCDDCEELQTKRELAKCPQVQVAGSPGIVYPDKPLEFALVSKGNDEALPLKYSWTVEHGHLIKGQGTPSISVMRESIGVSVKATVKVIGLPDVCLNTAFETYINEILLAPEKIGSIRSSSALPNTLINKIVGRMKGDPYSQLFVVMYLDDEREEQTFRKQIQQRLLENKVDLQRITYRSGYSSDKRIEIWIVRPGSDNPYVENN